VTHWRNSLLTKCSDPLLQQLTDNVSTVDIHLDVSNAINCSDPLEKFTTDINCSDPLVQQLIEDVTAIEIHLDVTIYINCTDPLEKCTTDINCSETLIQQLTDDVNSDINCNNPLGESTIINLFYFITKTTLLNVLHVIQNAVA